MDRKRVLWIDNDPAYLRPYLEEFEDSEYEVDVAAAVSDGATLLHTRAYALLILDVMIPTRSLEEENDYSPEDTKLGYCTGLVFYRRHREFLMQQRIAALVLTIRLDEPMREEFFASGLPRNAFATKYDMSDPAVLVEKVRSLVDRT
jgi:CheY-like chemotaxis protein